MQYLYLDSTGHVFMDQETFEQLTIPVDELEEEAGYLLPNMEVQVNFHNERPISLELPANVTLEVVDTEAVVRGQTAASSGKPARLETGITVIVPPFVTVGDRIRVNTGTGEYVERAS
jgi:elongation factor P